METRVLKGRSVISVPTTEKRPVTDAYHGVRVTDDYRWLEPWDDPAVRAWSDNQNDYARTVLERMPNVESIRARVSELRSAGSVSYRMLAFRPSTRAFGARSGRFFAIKTEPPRQQPLLVTFTDLDDPASEDILLDPVALDATALTSIDWFSPSPDGRLVAVSLSEAGSERGNVHVIDVATGRSLADVVPRVNHGTAGGGVAWAADASGFYYTRYPRPGERPDAELDFYVQIYFHALGTPTGEDRYEIGKNFPDIAEPKICVSPRGHHVLVNVQNGDGGEFSQFLRMPGGKWTRLTSFQDRVIAGYFAPGGSLLLLSRDGAPHGKLLRLELAGDRAPSMADAKTVVPERQDAVIQFDFPASDTVVATSTRIYVVDQWGGPNHISVFSLGGKSLGRVELPPVTAVPEIVGLPDDGLLIRSTSYLEADVWFELSPPDARPVRRAISSRHPADFSDAEVVREMAASKDGTQVPLSILRRKGTPLDGSSPAILYGYGGFGVSRGPWFWPTIKVWLEQGGIFAVANIRGGGEFGEAWHAGGKLMNKQNSFDDFIAAAEHLTARKYTNPNRLALRGGSNGGLLVGAVMTQRPDLANAVVASVGIFDMLRSELEANGVFNIPEVGTVKDREQFHALHSYSPFHRVRDGERYPAVLFLTGANDPRVDPMNSRKMTARLQAASTQPEAVLLRTSTAAGHGHGTALAEIIEQDVEIFTFLFAQLNVQFREEGGG